MQRRDRVPSALLAAYAVVWTWSAIAPGDRFIWFAENLLVFIGLPVLVLTYRRFAFATGTYVAMFAFLALHAVGAHYGYTQVPIPWREWGFGRNHTDRLMHLLFGLLAVLPVEEILRRLARIRRGWRGPLAVTCTFALAAAFEIVEWLAYLVGGDAVGPTEGGYLGTQGDAFDAVKDMGLGLLGATITAALLALRRRPHQSEAPLKPASGLRGP